MKTIKQLSTELGISKEAVYKKLKYQLKEQLENHVTKIDNVTHIDADGELIIKQSLGRDRQEALRNVMDESATVESDDAPHITEYIRLLEDQIKTKDTQIETQNGHIGLLIRQLGGSQLLSQAERVKNLMATESAAFEPLRREPLWKRIFGKYR